MPYADYKLKLGRDLEDANKASQAARDIAERYFKSLKDFPPDDARRDKCAKSLGVFCETYFKPRFSLKWSPDHLRVIDKAESAILDGGLFALAMSRGDGKTTICECASAWADLYGYRRFVSIIGATEDHSEKMLDRIKTELMINRLLWTDFRAALFPIWMLENNARRCIGQLFNGERTDIEWGAKAISFPKLPDDAWVGAPNISGSRVSVSGLTGALRGQVHILPTGEAVRPDFAIIDDPQTRESAMSITQSNDRVAIVQGDVLGMAGPGKKIAAVMPCTVIREGDMADQLLNRELNPAWQGERTKMVYSWPVAEDLWAEYHKIRDEELASAGTFKKATAFYRKNRKAMDAGSKVSWPDRFNPDELSAIQHAMNLRRDRGDSVFFAEYQNEPLKDDLGDLQLLTAEQIADKTGGVPRGVVPSGAQTLTAFVDVHDTVLFWCVCAWGDDYSGWVVDYGTWPDQRTRQFSLRKAPKTMGQMFPKAGVDGAIRSGLDAVGKEILCRQWPREDGSTQKVGQALVDAGYKPSIVSDFCRRSDYSGQSLPSRGDAIGAARAPIEEYRKKPGERKGWYWIIQKATDRAGRYLRFDANHWKSFVHARLYATHGDAGSLCLYGKQRHEHALFAEHLTAEAPVRVTARGRTVDQWEMRPGRSDNHWLDCLVGCAVGASMLGVKLAGLEPVVKKKREPMTFAQWQASKQAKAGVR